MTSTKECSRLSLIIRLPNWVGDVVMALPTLQTLKQLGITLQLFGKPWASDLLANTDMDCISLTNNFKKNISIIAQQSSISKALLLTNSLSSAIIFYLSGKNSIGYKNDFRQLLLTSSLSKQPGQHEVQYFWNIARHASQYWFPQLDWPKKIPTRLHLPLCKNADTRAHHTLQKANIKGPFWVLCPFAHGKGIKGQPKNWPYWQALSNHLQHHQLVICPGKNEEAKCHALFPKSIILSGLNLLDYTAILAKAERVIANDSGPMHLSTAVNPNTLGIFGVTDPKRSSPWGADYIGASNQWPSLSQVLEVIKC